MKKNVNLSIDSKLISQIKSYAANQEVSVSFLVEEYFKTIVKNKPKDSLIELIESLPKPNLPYPDDIDFKKQYYEEKIAKLGYNQNKQ